MFTRVSVHFNAHSNAFPPLTLQNVWKIVLAVLAVAVVVILIAVPTALFLNEKKEDPRRTFTLNDYFNSTIRARSFNLRWLSGEPVLFLTMLYNYSLVLTQNKRQFVLISCRWCYNPTLLSLNQAYVWMYNVYVKDSPTTPSQQVTFNGAHNRILNGIPDWVYEEEMFSTNHALWWSPTGRYLAFAEFNDTNVHTIEYSWYGEGQYPDMVVIPYPKAGTPNPTVRLFVADATKVSRIMEVVVPSAVGEGEHYLSTVTWATDDRIAVQWQNRTQSYLTLLQYFWFCMFLLSLFQFSPDDPVFHPSGSTFYYIMSDSNGFKHIHHVSEVSSFFTAAALTRLEVSIEGSTHSQPVCLTCTVNEDRCQYNSAYFSTEGTYYRMDCSGERRPNPKVLKLTDWHLSFSEIRVLEDNKNLDSVLQDIAMPTVTHGTMRIELWYQMTLPPNFDQSKKYPLLIDVYAGPCSQKSDFRFRINWSTYLASTENVIVASFDGRGSGYQGDKIMHSIYKRLGTYEVEDQITAARHFINLGYVDKEKMAIWGWSYGGYVTSMVMGAGSGVFKCGMAVAPVSKWEYYDSIYTERYMLTPAENQAFYDNSTVTGRAKNFKTVQYLLVHGTADDNVHFQQAAQISKALVDEQVDFDSMWYTDEDHSLGGSANQHVYTHLSHFLKSCFA
uniref:Dipeptidyl-peptidase 4 n=1 Tax=Pygocentrus nattereri TaxID=42514 RepID=A0AAR2LY37_PYGNA